MKKNNNLENLPQDIQEEILALKEVCGTHSVEAIEGFQKVLDYFLNK